jgi:5-methyltetrahydrofolate--homocysteine methyltransferase
MPDILRRLGREVLVIDGAFGTMLQREGVPPEQCPEQLNITGPEIVSGIHHNYVLAGADCVTTNSFGGTRFKLAEYGLESQIEELNRAAVRVARASGAMHILGGMGPTGRVLEPLGQASFDEVFAAFAEQAAALAAGEPDALIIETMTDIAEARCAVLAARSICELPIFVTCTFGLNGRMDLSGTDPATAGVILEAAGATAVGMNCGLGPEQMLPLVEQMAGATVLPIIVQPNAGLPRLVDGETVFPGTADEMGGYAARFVGAGAVAVGSCCGSTPAFTGAIVDFAKELPVRTDRTGFEGLVIAGPRGLVRIGSGQPLCVIGERINPTGKPALADSLREGSMTVVRSFATAQEHAGAHALDVNVGAAGVDAAAVLPAAVLALVGFADLPLVIDTTDPVALDAALRIYPGRALINSVNGSPESLESVLPIAETYGAAVVVLALDDDGIPVTVEGRLAIVERVRAAARAHGLRDKDLLVDSLVLTAATDPQAARVTLETTRAVSHDLGLATMLGVSNVSHGLPGRSSLNAAFLAMATATGLDAAIANPDDRDVAGAVKAANALLGADDQAADWIAWSAAIDSANAAAGRGGTGVATDSRRGPSEDGSAGSRDTAAAHELAAAVSHGDADAAPGLVDAVIREGLAAADVIDSVLTPAIQELGERFGRGEVFLPQLIVSADAMKAAVTRVKTYLPEGDGSGEGRVVFATVKGDIHSIGKDICVSMLESQGFVVHDLGVDVAEETVLAAADGADAVCLSALMTTTLPSMQRSVETLAQRYPGLPVLVGGAVVTGEWATTIGAAYSADAPGCVIAVRDAIAKGRA